MSQQFHIQSRRGHERVSVALPMCMAGLTGMTRDVSLDGIYFELDSMMDFDSEISFDVALESHLGQMKLKCTGQVVRTEQRPGKTGVAVKIIDSHLEAAD
jgi:hypothetical protein